MKITRLYSGTDGESHFDEVEVNLFSSGSGLVMSKPFKAKNVCIKADNGNCDVPWHNHPQLSRARLKWRCEMGLNAVLTLAIFSLTKILPAGDI
jgi:hypothetical protein